jgi:hypothetical protein
MMPAKVAVLLGRREYINNKGITGLDYWLKIGLLAIEE